MGMGRVEVGERKRESTLSFYFNRKNFSVKRSVSLDGPDTRRSAGILKKFSVGYLQKSAISDKMEDLRGRRRPNRKLLKNRRCACARSPFQVLKEKAHSTGTYRMNQKRKPKKCPNSLPNRLVSPTIP